jgi:AcrR family transcriptional regulator
MPDRKARDILRLRALESAADLRLREGAAAVTIEALSRAGGQSPTAMSLLFGGSDDELRAAALTALQAEIEARVRAAVDRESDPLKALRYALRVYVNTGLEWPSQYLSNYCLPLRDGQQTRPCPGIRKALEFAMEASALPSGDLDTTHYAVWTLVHGITATLAAAGSGAVTLLDCDHWIESSLDLIMAGLRHGHLLPIPPPDRAA